MQAFYILALCARARARIGMCEENKISNMQNIRNIAIIAHVDHGKTTLVDKMLYTANLFRENEQKGELILDNNELERERGIPLLTQTV